ncbi:MAG: RnfABCDGE type electron transport complex subunit C [Candidatus Omnitrophica bacterium]|nr:RnfABCDGE type electron transport complex subunit C [Candidatus Omnitrophota bacterium]MDD5670309.1 RnfABCDGE type electron transport complex subunit C [Candidatus Omnitrophota bacterium]
MRLEGKKEQSLVSWMIKRSATPRRVYVPLAYGEGMEVEPCVVVGQHVQAGEVIAVPITERAVTIHASIAGEVMTIGFFAHPFLGEATAIEIRAEAHQKTLPAIGHERTGWKNFSREEMAGILRCSGVVDLSSGMEPVHLSLMRDFDFKKYPLVLNACESEPYVTSAHALMMSHPVEILKGAEIMRTLAGAERVVIAIEENKLEAAELLKSKVYFLRWNNYEIKVLPIRYPQENPVCLRQKLFAQDPVDAVCNKNDFCPVFDVGTTVAVYEAVVMQKPLYERVITVSGECVVEAKNIWAPLGMTIKDAFGACRGLLREPKRVLVNGPMRGTAQPNLDTPVMPATQAVLALSRESVFDGESESCIRCHRCVEVCPMGISPMMVTLAAENDLFEISRHWGLDHCIECGNCAYICPAKRPMIDLIRYARLNDHQEKLTVPEPTDVMADSLQQESHQEKREALAEPV